jgi:heme-degrading monooxygenase HmoA
LSHRAAVSDDGLAPNIWWSSSWSQDRLHPSQKPPLPVSFDRELSVACSEQAQRSVAMFTRTVEVTAKSGKARELANTINEKVLPILKRQAGFVDETLLVSDAEPNQILALSFWNTKEDAERYQREQYPAVHEIVRNLLEAEPEIRTFNVDSSTMHRITASKAA